MTLNATLTPLRLAATAPQHESDDADEASTADSRAFASNAELHALCERWATWCRSRRMYVRPSLPPSLLGRLASKGTGRGGEGPDAICCAHLAAFHMAYLSQPQNARDRQAFELHYYWRVNNIKSAAAELGVSRQHWYRLVADCRARIHRTSLDILAINTAAANQLPSRRVITSDTPPAM